MHICGSIKFSFNCLHICIYAYTHMYIEWERAITECIYLYICIKIYMKISSSSSYKSNSILKLQLNFIPEETFPGKF